MAKSSPRGVATAGLAIAGAAALFSGFPQTMTAPPAPQVRLASTGLPLSPAPSEPAAGCDGTVDPTCTVLPAASSSPLLGAAVNIPNPSVPSLLNQVVTSLLAQPLFGPGGYLDMNRCGLICDGANSTVEGQPGQSGGWLFGNGGRGGVPGTLYFTAGPDDESHGLFGSLEVARHHRQNRQD